MMVIPGGPSISTRHALKILRHLAQQQQRLATDAAYFEGEVDDLQDAAMHLIQQGKANGNTLKQLLRQERQLFEQVATVAAAALSQLATQLDSNIQVSRAVMAVGAALSMLVSFVRGRTDNSDEPSTAADTSNLAMLRDTGRVCGSASAPTGVVCLAGACDWQTRPAEEHNN